MLLQVHGMEILNLILGCQLRDLFLGGTKTIGKREARGGIRTKGPSVVQSPNLYH